MYRPCACLELHCPAALSAHHQITRVPRLTLLTKNPNLTASPPQHCPQSKVREQLQREQDDINMMQDRDYKQLQKNAGKYKKQLELQQQQEQHTRWAQLNGERQQARKLSTVRERACVVAPVRACTLLTAGMMPHMHVCAPPVGGAVC